MPSAPPPTGQGPLRPAPPKRPPPWRSSRWWIFVGVMLLLNILLANLTSGPGTKRVTIPYSTFKAQVQHDNVASVTGTAESIDGHAKKPVSAPGSSDSSVDFH